MSSDIHLAFAHPSERSAATARPGPLDRISLRDHIVEVEIGAFQQERGTTQRVCFNVVVEIAPLPADLDDDVDRILSYDKVTEAIAHELARERLALLETLAERVAERILWEPQAVRAFVRIEKLDRGPGKLGVEIVRSSDQVSHETEEDIKPHPRLMFLSNTAIDSDNLTGWIDQMECRERPLILCVGAHELALPQTGHKWTQRRIDLLAIEQNAWRLAARDERCKVVETRTELDWAMKNGQICVWAPSKIVLDAVEGPSEPPSNAVALAAWFASTFEAEEMIVIGAELPDNPGVPLRAHAEEQHTL
ncbi:dihydroneopterin aldolase [Tritonibacter mobilis]|jgi:dihydroneopterin aldolase|uniref:dihydroneopterin aldolase n=1 Tax=Tritonibacter mobilis TaxID=379347 RepID=UPI0001B8A7F0|nr:dihydroneopterin aldolase [Tritonibacter mobilis]EEW60014.1 dihydroneopterin aldolase [Ruegeria sp. TrichCH4B]MCZ4267420.1 dihydroneopterin aldolase [Rhodobacteraceae bacterium G21628-S1]MEE2811001.1 dihydroneopterin aldolase [Pseudomonadota bacterium]NKX29019.1 FolB domain-containing protein [Rhodobacteraceae bacterium R_SAG6]NKX72751.1 FolB domain-containing protein [Rhodobacteraceae bacterium R_SAG3]